MLDSEPTSNRRWDDYKHLSDLFQFYLELVFKAFTFTLGVSGAVVTFVLGKEVQDDRHTAAFGILLPAVLCIGMGIAFLRAIPSAHELTDALNRLKVALGLELAPHGRNLSTGLTWFGILLVVAGVFLCGLFIHILRACFENARFAL